MGRADEIRGVEGDHEALQDTKARNAGNLEVNLSRIITNPDMPSSDTASQ